MKIALTVLASLALASGAQAKENGKDHAPGQLKKQPPAEVQAPVQQKVAPQAQSSPPGHTPNANPGGQKQGEKYPTPNGGRGIPGCGPSDSQPKKCNQTTPGGNTPPGGNTVQPPAGGRQETPATAQAPSGGGGANDQQGTARVQKRSDDQDAAPSAPRADSPAETANIQTAAKPAKIDGLPFTGLSIGLLALAGLLALGGGFLGRRHVTA